MVLEAQSRTGGRTKESLEKVVTGAEKRGKNVNGEYMKAGGGRNSSGPRPVHFPRDLSNPARTVKLFSRLFYSLCLHLWENS